MKYHEMKEKEVEQALNTNFRTGLSQSSVEINEKSSVGMNYQKEKSNPLYFCFSANSKILWYLVLLGATLVSGLLGEYIDAVAIMAIVFINGILGFFQESKAEKSFRCVKKPICASIKCFERGKMEEN